MVARPALVAVALLTSLLNVGCGTVCNLCHPDRTPKAFGGPAFDADVLARVYGRDPSREPLSNSNDPKEAAILLIMLSVGPFLDLPLSFVGDLLTYPLARWLDGRHSPAHVPADPDSPPDS
jgi:uncharacterized protein YceK